MSACFAGIMRKNQNNLLNSCAIFILYICNLQVWRQAALEPRRRRVEYQLPNTFLLFSEMECLQVSSLELFDHKILS
jgi:hypothetical protein